LGLVWYLPVHFGTNDLAFFRAFRRFCRLRNDHGRWALAEFFADRLLRQEPVKALLTETDVLLPVPLHRVRQISRGYNQSQVLANRLSQATNIRLAEPVIRIRNTETQIKVHSRAKREENLRDAFALIQPKLLEGRHVVLVDDVTTTGATFQSLARAIKPAKPASISALAIAIADPKGRAFSLI
jgi:ComF family protein